MRRMRESRSLCQNHPKQQFIARHKKKCKKTPLPGDESQWTRVKSAALAHATARRSVGEEAKAATLHRNVPTGKRETGKIRRYIEIQRIERGGLAASHEGRCAQTRMIRGFFFEGCSSYCYLDVIFRCVGEVTVDRGA